MRAKETIVDLLKNKSLLKQHIYDTTFELFGQLKEVLREVMLEINAEVQNEDSRIHLMLNEHGAYAAELVVAGDTIIFLMHTNVFEFPDEHLVKKSNILANDPHASLSGIINIYNFLSDSFRYERSEDMGYLIGRLFVNKDLRFCIEGQAPLDKISPDFGEQLLDREMLRSIVYSVIATALNFDLLVPDYADMEVVTVAQMVENYETNRIKTSKRMGFQFYST